MLEAGLAIVTKVRPAHELATAAEVVGDVRGKIAVMGDDMIVTGGTLFAAADALRQQGASEVHVFATHALLTPDAATRLAQAGIAGIAVTDTVALDLSVMPETLTVLSTADLLAETIRNVFADRSVSALFAGENELF
jgi:ribose-phosphate pyrophosphokinase